MQQSLPARAVAGIWALLFCALAMAYLPALGGGPLWDDDHHITSRDLRSFEGLRRIWFEPGATQQYYPLSHSAFWVEHRLWSDATAGYHLANLAWHATAALLLILILRRLGIPGAWLAGFLFALHPVCVEAVAWISEQKTLLAAALYLGSALAYLHFDETRRRREYVLAAVLFVLALAAKTVSATLPAALLVVLWWKRGRIDWRRDVLPLAPWLVLGAAAGLFTAWMERASIGAQGADFDLSFAQRCLVAAHALWFYAAKLVWPANLMFTYPRWNPGEGFVYLAGTIVAAATLVWLSRRGQRGPLAAFLFFAGTLFPALGFFNVYPFLFSFVADHFQYLASLGILVPAAALLWGRVFRADWRAAAVFLLLPGWLTWRQSAAYRDAESLYRTTLERNPASWMAHTNLAALLLRRPGGVAEAITECEAALRLRPAYAEAHNNLGSALAQTAGGLSEAIAQFQAALASRPNFPEAHFNLANALAQIPGRQSDALAEYEAALRLRPDYVEARLNRGAVLLRLPGRLPDAIADFREALRIDPHLAEARNNLGSALAQMPGRAEDALAEFRAALAEDPHSARAHNNLGTFLAQMPGRLPEAIAEYQAALREKPDYAEAHYNLGLALARVSRPDEAIAEFAAAVRLDPDSARAHYNLGVLLMRTQGHESEALAQFEAALRLRPDPALERLVDRLKAARSVQSR